MPNTNQNAHGRPRATLNYARQYHEAAEELFHSKPHLSWVLYEHYFHVTELLLKAYLQAHNRKPGRVHKIGKLYNECRSLGLTISSDDQFNLENVVNLLESGNADAAFRYSDAKFGSIPELSWTREVVGQLMQVVAAFVESNTAPSSGRLSKLILMFGKPYSTEDATS